MNWTIDTTSLPAYIRVCVKGSASIRSLTAMWDEVLAIETWKPGTCVFLDCRALEPIEENAFNLASQLVDLFLGSSDLIGDGRIALMMTPPINYLFYRQFQYSLGLRGSTHVQIFSDELQATNWLQRLCGVEA